MNLRRDDDLSLSNALVELAHLEAAEGLEEAGAVVGARAVLVLEHLLGDLAIELGGGVGEVGLDVDELLELVELAVHLEHGNLLTEEGVGSVEELDARVRAGQLAAAGDPRDGGALVEKVGGVKVLDTLLHDHAHAEDLALVVVGDELGGEHLDDDIGVLLLGVDELVEVGLARLDRSLDGLERVATLGHVALNLPGELNVIGDIEVNLEVEHLTDTLVREGVEALENENVGGFNLLGGVEHASDVVVDGLVHGLALLERLDLVVHEVCYGMGNAIQSANG